MELEQAATPYRQPGSDEATWALARLTGMQWLVCLSAGAGFLFDMYEVVVQGLLMRPALIELSGLEPGTRPFNLWVSLLFYLPLLAGGIAGLLGGQLTDRYGRRRMLVWSIVLYGAASVGAAHASSPAELLLWRCVTIIGVCTEWVAATAWIAELFSERRQREAALGFTQAIGGVGVLLVGGVYYMCVTYGGLLPPIRASHSAWRYALMFGALPVLPILIARLILPESPRWQELKAAGALRRPRFRELFQPAYRRTTILSCLLAACIYGTTFGATQHMPRIVPGLAQVSSLPRIRQEQVIGLVHTMSDLGSLLGRVSFAILVVVWLSGGKLLRAFQLPALVVFPLLYLSAPYLNLWALACGVLLAGMLLNGQMSFLGNYLPQAYPVYLRGTGESFAISVGARIIGTSAAVLTTFLANFTPGANASQQLAYAAAVVSTLACVGGFLAGRWLPEPKHSADDS